MFKGKYWVSFLCRNSKTITRLSLLQDLGNLISITLLSNNCLKILLDKGELQRTQCYYFLRKCAPNNHNIKTTYLILYRSPLWGIDHWWCAVVSGIKILAAGPLNKLQGGTSMDWTSVSSTFHRHLIWGIWSQNSQIFFSNLFYLFCEIGPDRLAFALHIYQWTTFERY